MRVDQTQEYGVEVPGRGYIGWYGDLRQDLEVGLNSFDEAAEVLDSAVKRYKSMGCPEVAETLHIVSRTVTVTRSDWNPSKRPVIDAPTGTLIDGLIKEL